MWISYGYGLADGSGGNLSSDVFVNEFIAAAQPPTPTINYNYNEYGLQTTAQAKALYYAGTGKPAALGNNVIKDLLNSNEFKLHNGNIVSGKTTRMSGNFGVNLTSVDFFVGRTDVTYSIQVNGNSATVTFNLFVNDGFWDPNFIAERTLGALGVKKYQPDGMGPNLEADGGHPYPFIPVVATETFPNPGYH